MILSEVILGAGKIKGGNPIFTGAVIAVIVIGFILYFAFGRGRR